MTNALIAGSAARAFAQPTSRRLGKAARDGGVPNSFSTNRSRRTRQTSPTGQWNHEWLLAIFPFNTRRCTST